MSSEHVQFGRGADQSRVRFELPPLEPGSIARLAERTLYPASSPAQLITVVWSGMAQVSVPEVAFDFLVSAEKTVAAASPSGKTVFEQRVEDK